MRGFCCRRGKTGGQACWIYAIDWFTGGLGEYRYGTGYSVEKNNKATWEPKKSHREDQMHSGKVRENLRRRWAILKLEKKEKAKIAQYLLTRESTTLTGSFDRFQIPNARVTTADDPRRCLWLREEYDASRLATGPCFPRLIPASTIRRLP